MSILFKLNEKDGVYWLNCYGRESYHVGIKGNYDKKWNVLDTGHNSISLPKTPLAFTSDHLDEFARNKILDEIRRKISPDHVRKYFMPDLQNDRETIINLEESNTALQIENTELKQLVATLQKELYEVRNGIKST